MASYVLSACALGSGCGSVLRGFVERAFPYAHLTNREEWESMYVRRNLPSMAASVANSSDPPPFFFFGKVLDILLG